MQIYRAILTPFLTRNYITGCLSEQSFTTGGRFAQAIPNPFFSSEGKKAQTRAVHGAEVLRCSWSVAEKAHALCRYTHKTL